MSLSDKIIEKWKWYPTLTIILAVTLILVFELQQIYSLESYYFVPANAPTQPWIFTTSIFLHASPQHLLLNLIALLIFGIELEYIVGISKKFFLLTFILAGVSGGFIDIMTLAPHGSSLGASGSIFGLIGLRTVGAPSTIMLFFAVWWGAYNLRGLLFHPMEPIGYGSHLVGLFTGILLALYWRKTAPSKYGEL